MAVIAVPGVVAAGRVPTWIIPAASITVDPSGLAGGASWKIPIAALTGVTTVKADCHMDIGDVTVSRTPTTKSRQRMCQIVAETVSTGETIDITLAAVFDQQQLATVLVNKVYAALPEGSVVYIAQAFGWDSGATPTTTTIVDLFKATVQTRTKNQPTSFDEDLKFTAALSGSAYWADVTISAT
jgi:hypothetical protein